MFGSRGREPEGIGRCSRHQFNDAVALCAKCNGPSCQECVVYPYGRKRQPLCVHCALVVGGVRRR